MLTVSDSEQIEDDSCRCCGLSQNENLDPGQACNALVGGWITRIQGTSIELSRFSKSQGWYQVNITWMQGGSKRSKVTLVGGLADLWFVWCSSDFPSSATPPIGILFHQTLHASFRHHSALVCSPSFLVHAFYTCAGAKHPFQFHVSEVNLFCRWLDKDQQ